MKKNKMMRLASAMMVTTLMTTSVISGTFAKYVTSDKASDDARVAKWGITVQAGGNLFGTKYAEHNAANYPDSIATESVNVVSSGYVNSIINVVAPGTQNNTGFAISIKGTPEVDYVVTATNNAVEAEDIFLKKGEYGVMVAATGLNSATNMTGYYILDSDGKTYKPADVWVAGKDYYELHDYVDVAADYYPLVWTVAETGKAAADTAKIETTTDLNAIATEMVTKIGTLGGAANSPADASYTLTWSWPYESAANDGADTILGNLMAGEKVVTKSGSNYTSEIPAEKYNLEVKFGLAVTVTQVD